MMHQVDLGWALAAAADHYLDETERIDIYIALGAGDTSAAIHQLTTTATRDHIELPPSIVSALTIWWAAHEGDHRTAVLITQLPTRPPPPPVRSAIKPLTVARKRQRAS